MRCIDVLLKTVCLQSFERPAVDLAIEVDDIVIEIANDATLKSADTHTFVIKILLNKSSADSVRAVSHARM